MKTDNETSSIEPQTNQPLVSVSPSPIAAPRGKAGIGGCLLYPVLFLVAQPIAFVVALSEFSKPKPYYMRYSIYWPSMIADLITLGLVMILSVVFFRKKRILPALFIVVVACLFVLWTGMTFLLLRRAGTPDPIRSFMVLFLQCFILIPYFTLSKRVKNTFVRDLDGSSLLDILFVPMAGPLERLYNWLVRIGKWVFLLVLGFVTVVIGINVVIGLILGRSI